MPQSVFRIHLTNVAGVGASQLLQSLLPALELDSTTDIKEIFLPDRGLLAEYESENLSTTVSVYKRMLPNALSRVFECTLMAQQFDGCSPLLVLGDLPLRSRGPQTVFVQNANLLNPDKLPWRSDKLRYWVSQRIFSLNLKRANSFIVQTELMRAELEQSYPCVKGKVRVIAQPVPSWLLNSGLRRRTRLRGNGDRMRLVYPAANYPHKNHKILAQLDEECDLHIEQLVLTLDPEKSPAPNLSWLKCRGFLSPDNMIECYADADALLFLSKKESYGFPLVEAMFVGLPIVCPDLPYARTLCGNQAIYFDPDLSGSLQLAIQKLRQRLEDGWWPDWRKQLQPIPKDWQTVARRMLDVAGGRMEQPLVRGGQTILTS